VGNIKIYAAKINSDQTEGRGPMMVKSYHQTTEGAYDAVKGQGVMGVGDGEIDEIIVPELGTSSCRNIYGYHRNWRGKWVHGWVDEDSLPPQEEAADYQKYLELKTKFEGKMT
jgi:hypothetical protein